MPQVNKTRDAAVAFANANGFKCWYDRRVRVTRNGEAAERTFANYGAALEYMQGAPALDAKQPRTVTVPMRKPWQLTWEPGPLQRLTPENSRHASMAEAVTALRQHYCMHSHHIRQAVATIRYNPHGWV